MTDKHSSATRRVEDKPFSVRCISCDAKMRDSKMEDATGQCWKCYYRILNDHLRSQRRSPNFLFASER